MLNVFAVDESDFDTLIKSAYIIKKLFPTAILDKEDGFFQFYVQVKESAIDFKYFNMCFNPVCDRKEYWKINDEKVLQDRKIEKSVRRHIAKKLKMMYNSSLF